MNFICENGLTHDKPVTDGNPSSNNGWIYTAIRVAVGLSVDFQKLIQTYFKCCRDIWAEILIDRLPGKEEPPLSHDEAIGLYLLGLLSYKRLKENHFVFHGKGEPVTPRTFFVFLRGIFKLFVIAVINRKTHRNDFWKYNVEEIETFAFRFHPGYVYFLKKDNGERPHFEEKLYWRIFTKKTIESGTGGQKNILFAMAKKLKDQKLIDQLNPKESLVGYFKKGHPIADFALENL